MEQIKYTREDKYKILMDKYLPPMYKRKVSKDDLTPWFIALLNECFADGFTFIEELVNRLPECLDADLMHEDLLPIKAEDLGIKLRTNKVGKWREQIKHAIPFFKKKGTEEGMALALADADIKLNKITPLWQIASSHFWTDGFVVRDSTEIILTNREKHSAVDANTIVGELSHHMIDKNFSAYIRASDTKEYITIPAGCLELIESLRPGEKKLVSWQGGSLKTPVHLYSDDVLLITYKIKEIPSNKAAEEEYLQSLPLADTRDELDQKYPLKNWNLRLIEEDDVMFNVLIPEKHPFFDPVIFGKIRTTFLYSEKVYNMDTFNGSLRDSHNPCDIDKEFIDKCYACQSSSFNVDLEMDEVTEENIQNAREIIEEFSPFHTRLFKMHVKATVRDNLVVKDSIKSHEQNPDVIDTVKMGEKINFKVEWKDGKVEKGNL